MPSEPAPPARATWWRLLLLLPVIGVLAVPFYVHGPALGPFPFFFWYQLLWVLLCSVVTAIVFAGDKAAGDAP